MNAPWFDPNLYSWIPGTALGVLGGTWGALVGTLAPRGRARGFLTACTAALLAACGVLLVAGLVALLSGQPYGVWYGLGLPGVIGLLVVGLNGRMLPNIYRQAEERRMAARDVPL